MNSIYHNGELAVQAQAGVQKTAQRVGNSIRDFIPPVAQIFLHNQTMVVIGSSDEAGHLWASLLTGAPGFMQVLDPHTLQLDATSVLDDLLFENVRANSNVGLIAIEFASRQRMRLNGNAQVQSDNTLLIQAQQVYSNCPKYTQARKLDMPMQAQPAVVANRTTSLTDAQRALITQADTFFIATAHPQGGTDASHRGGNPGFVTAIDENTLVWPDYAGNMMFNTLGNIAVNPHTGLLFLDFEQGNLLQLSGTAEIIWEETKIAQYTGAERLVTFRIEQVIEKEGVLPFKWQFESYSPYNP